MYKFLISLIFLVNFAVCGFSQQKFTLSGYIKDASDGEALTGATVYAKELKKGTAANTYGFYSLTLEKGIYTLIISYVGYETYTATVDFTKNQTRNIELKPIAVQMQEAVISATRTNDDNVNSTNMGTNLVPVESIKKMPAFFGEADLIKTIQLLPGIQSAGEGSTGYHVRGGGLDQNLVLLDNAVIYNLGHLFGFFSIFNADAIRSVEMIKGGMPANFGGRLASVLNVSMKEGNMKHFEAEGGAGIVFARLNVQSPIVKDKASFLITARRTYIDALVQPFLDSSNPMKGIKFYFYDLNGKVNWKINDKHRIFLSGYYGTDVYGFNGENTNMNARLYWGNSAGSFRWNYNINRKLFLNTSAMVSDFAFKTEMASDVYKLGMKSGIRDYSFNSELTCLPVAGNILKTGVNYVFHHLTPSNYEAEMGSELNMPKPLILDAHELAAFVNEEIDLSEEIRLNAGLRGSYFQHIGEYKTYIPDNVGRIADSVIYKSGEKVKDYWGLEPRLSLRFAIDKDLSLKISYTYNYQYLHQVALSSISLPTDEWIISSADIKPQRGSQYAIGLYQNMKRNMYEFSVEAYYKDMKNLTEYREGYSPFTAAMQSLDRQYTQGDGYSYGLEFLLNKTYGKLTGWIGYSLSWSKRQFPELNGGKEFYAKNDRRHDISISLSYDILPNLTTSIVWVYATGNTMTVPIGFYFVGYSMVTEYSSKNAYRVPPYHRMDFSVNWTIRKTKHFEHGLNFSIYNAYNRKNPFFISIGSNMNADKMQVQNTAYQMSLFPILPSLSWNFKFK